jgi:tetratricopeptide (TPR) repeat protein
MSEQKPAHVAASVNAGMSVGGSKSPGKARFQAKLLGLILFILVIIAAAVWFVVWHSRSSSSSNNTATTSKNTPAPPSNISLDQKAQYYANEGDYQAAEQSWQQKLAGDTSTTDKVADYYQLSALAVQFKQYSDAKKYANDIMQVAPDAPDSYVALAQLAQAQNNIPQAKQYWQQAIDHVSSNTPGYTRIRGDYIGQLDALK